MISTPDRQQAVTLIAAARAEGARLEPACAVVGITVRTHQRWTREGDIREDQRPLIDRAAPANALSAEETQAILDACHRPDHASLPPDQIVVRLMASARFDSQTLLCVILAGTCQPFSNRSADFSM